MKIWHCVFAATVCLAMVGCHTDPHILMLERENRLLEDEIWRLRWALEDCGGCAPVSGPNLIPPGQLHPGAAPGTAGSGISRAASEAAPGTGLPRVDLGEPVQEGEQPKIFKRQPSEAPSKPAPDAKRLQPTPLPPPREQLDEAPRFKPNETPRLAPPADSSKVELITLHERLCGGYNADGRDGDEGIRLVLEPRNAHGRILAAPADVAVVVLDPALPGEAARVARWDFPADEIARRFRNGGVLLEALWPAPPQHSDLHLFVRYTTRDGRCIETDRSIRVALPGETSRRWAPAEPRPVSATKLATPPGPGPSLQAEQPVGPATAACPAWSPYRDR